MNLQRREEIREMMHKPAGNMHEMYHDIIDMQQALSDMLAHIDALEQTAAERVIADGKAPAVVVPEISWRELNSAVDGALSWQEAAKSVNALFRKNSRAIPADRVLGEGVIATRWIHVSESLPEDGESVGFVINSTRDEWNHGRAVGGRFNRKHFDKGLGGFSFPGIEWAASHWCKLPPIPDAIRANQGGAGNARV